MHSGFCRHVWTHITPDPKSRHKTTFLMVFICKSRRLRSDTTQCIYWRRRIALNDQHGYPITFRVQYAITSFKVCHVYISSPTIAGTRHVDIPMLSDWRALSIYETQDRHDDYPLHGADSPEERRLYPGMTRSLDCCEVCDLCKLYQMRLPEAGTAARPSST